MSKLGQVQSIVQGWWNSLIGDSGSHAAAASQPLMASSLQDSAVMQALSPEVRQGLHHDHPAHNQHVDHRDLAAVIAANPDLSALHEATLAHSPHVGDVHEAYISHILF